MASERLLQLLIALLTAQGSVMLGMGSGNLTLPLLTIVAATLSLYVTDRYRWFYLQGSVANLAALCAVLLSIYDFFELERDRQLLAIAYLLVYLQIVLLFQRKTERVYWQLHLLSLLQVVVATAISSSLGFGLLLLVYLYFCLWTGFVFFVVRQQNRQRTLSASSLTDISAASFSTEATVDTKTTHFHPRLALAALRQATGICFLAFLSFLLLPRVGDSTSNQKLIGARMIGFTDSVRLGELGTAIESQEPVLRLWFFEPHADKPFRLLGSPMLRGAIVNYYKNGTWSIAGSQMWTQEIEIPISPPNAVKQRIAMTPLRERTVFALYPPALVDPQTPVAFNLRTRQLVRTVSQSTPFDVVLATSGIRDRRQKRLTAIGPTDVSGDVALLQPFDGTRKSNKASERLEPLRTLAVEILSQADLADDETVERAEAICDYLKTSPKFRYSLTTEQRNPDLDPIIDFLTEHPQGHCEYFSSALTLMLRSVGIRARMVIGFQGGQWNHLGDYYQIRQKDAHSWTEAYIPESELDGFPGGGWLRLDPTPGNLRIDRQINSGVALRFYGEIRNYAEFLWAKYVVQLDAQRQREDIYDRLAGWANVLIDSVLQAVLVNDVKPEHEIPVGEADVEEEAGMFQKKLDGWRLTLWTAAVLLLCGCILLLRKLYRGGLRCGHSFPVKQHVLERRPFYRQWERLLARHLSVRRPGQTARQHAAQIALQLIDCGLTDQQGVPARVVDAHYAYLFGGALPGAVTEAELVRGITALGKALAIQRRDALKTS
jgi:transglutaminase-like putative cysteine protease